MTKHRLTPQTRTKAPQRVSNPQTRARDNPQGKRQREEKAVNANVLNFLTKSEVKP